MLPIRARVESGLLDAGEALVRGSADRLSPAQALLQTKLARPRAPSDEIARPRLLESLSAGLGSAVTLLFAPETKGRELG